MRMEQAAQVIRHAAFIRALLVDQRKFSFATFTTEGKLPEASSLLWAYPRSVVGVRLALEAREPEEDSLTLIKDKDDKCTNCRLPYVEDNSVVRFWRDLGSVDPQYVSIGEERPVTVSIKDLQIVELPERATLADWEIKCKNLICGVIRPQTRRHTAMAAALRLEPIEGLAESIEEFEALERRAKRILDGEEEPRDEKVSYQIPDAMLRRFDYPGLDLYAVDEQFAYYTITKRITFPSQSLERSPMSLILDNAYYKRFHPVNISGPTIKEGDLPEKKGFHVTGGGSLMFGEL